MYDSGTYVDSAFYKMDMTPLRDDLEYDLSWDCKAPLYANHTFEVMDMDPEVQMCMYEMTAGAPIDLFNIMRMIARYSLSFDVQWMDDVHFELTNENLDLLSNILPQSALNFTRITDGTCRELKYGSVRGSHAAGATFLEHKLSSQYV